MDNGSQHGSISSPIHNRESEMVSLGSLIDVSLSPRNSRRSDIGDNTCYRALNPFIYIGIALLISLIYAIIPNSNIWIFILLKQELWSLFGVAVFAELTILSIPSFPSHLYELQYILGSILPIAIRVVAYLTHCFNNVALQYFCSIIGLPVSIVLLVYNARNMKQHSHVSSIALRELGYHDMYSCSIDSVALLTSSGENYSKPVDDSRQAQGNTASTCSVGRGRWIETLMRDRAPTASSGGPHQNTRCGIVLPRQFYVNHNIPLGLFTGDLITQSSWLVAFFAVFNGYYAFLEYFALLFRKKHSTIFFAGHFLVFVLGSMAIRTILKRAGMQLDANKRGSTSMYFLGEIAGLLYFYTFYRVLFETIHDWSVFLIFQLIHLATEWLAYPARASPAVYTALSQFQERLGQWHSILRYAIIPAETDLADWLEFIALDYGLRLVVVVAATLAIGCLLLVTTFVPWIHSDLAEDDDARHLSLGYSLVFIGLALVAELANALVINHLFFAARKMDLRKKVLRCFDDMRFSVVVLIFATNLFINPVYVWSTDTSFHYSQ